MRKIVTITAYFFSATLCAKSEEVLETDYFNVGQKIDKIEESRNYSQVDVDPSSMEIVDISYVEDIQEEQIAEILHKTAVEENMQLSIDNAVNKEMAQVLQTQIAEDEKMETIQPSIEDLTHLVEDVETPAPAVETKSEALAIYESLFISIEDKQNINSLLMTMADNGVFKLLFEKKRLERIGHKISHVHPMRFLGTVFSDPRLVRCMYSIRRSGFKWDGFIDGFSERFKKEIKANNINKYIPGFAEMLDLKQADIQAYVNYKDFEGLVLYLMEKTRKRS